MSLIIFGNYVALLCAIETEKFREQSPAHIRADKAMNAH